MSIKAVELTLIFCVEGILIYILVYLFWAARVQYQKLAESAKDNPEQRDSTVFLRPRAVAGQVSRPLLCVAPITNNKGDFPPI